MKRDKDKKRQPNKWLVGGIFVLLLVLIGGGFLFSSRQKQKKRDEMAEQTARQFISVLEKQDYDQLVDLLDQESLKDKNSTPEEVAERYRKVFSGIGVTNVKAGNLKVEEDKAAGDYKASYPLVMNSAIGELPEQAYSFVMKEQEGAFKIVWTPALLFPEMEQEDTVQITQTEGKRGSILDRNGELLAGEGDAFQAGIHPAALGEGADRETALQAISETFNIPVESLEKALAQNWVTDESFVPFAIRDEGDTPEVKGVLYQQTKARLYPLKDAAAHLIGYVSQVTAEDIEKNPSLQPSDQIGKTGLEAALEDRLKGQAGGKLTLLDKEGEVRQVIKESEPKDGEEIRLTLDKNLQLGAFKALGDDSGSSVVIDPKTGELLVLASSPSYDPVKMSRGISTEEYKAYAEDDRSPFLARYAARYAPGSTFKVLTGAIGLDAGTLDPNERFTINGLKWQKDASWGSDSVTRVSDSVTEVDLRSAYLTSDNIYFAMQALKMGGEAFKKGLDAFPFGEKTTLPLSLKPAQYTDDETFSSEKQLADTAYGQGQVLMSAIDQAWFYSAIANEGILPEVSLLKEKETGENPETVQVISAEAAGTVKKYLKEVVTDPKGTAHSLADLSLPLAAKTGTAEFKRAEKEGNDTNGFLMAFDADQTRFLLVSMIEDGSGGDAVKASKPYLKQLYEEIRQPE